MEFYQCLFYNIYFDKIIILNIILERKSIIHELKFNLDVFNTFNSLYTQLILKENVIKCYKLFPGQHF